MISYDFSDKIIIVTGATKGIGRSIAMALLDANAKVVITYSADDAAAIETEEIIGKNRLQNAFVTKSDISNRLDVKALLTEAEERWHSPISGIVNNAGILKQGDFFRLDEMQWDATFGVNLKGPFMLCQEYLAKNYPEGTIVNIASIGGQIGGDKAPDYAASKAALISLTRSLARIGSKFNVRVNAVAPGWIETPIFSMAQISDLKIQAKEKILLGRMGLPHEVASAVLFLLSDAASYITGHCLNVNGGMYFG